MPSEPGRGLIQEGCTLARATRKAIRPPYPDTQILPSGDAIAVFEQGAPISATGILRCPQEPYRVQGETHQTLLAGPWPPPGKGQLNQSMSAVTRLKGRRLTSSIQLLCYAYF